MKVRQISVFIENESGRIYEVARMLGENGINIRALSLADTSDFGIIRLIVNDPVTAHDVLKKGGFTVGINDVVAIAIPDVPGGLGGVLSILQTYEINIEYMYAFVNNSGSTAVMVFRFDDTKAALETLQGTELKFLAENTIFNI